MTHTFAVSLSVDNGMGVLEWQGCADQITINREVEKIANEAIIMGGLDRLEAQVRSDDLAVIQAFHHARFRQEGCRRRAGRSLDGAPCDLLIYSRLSDDQVEGPDGFTAMLNTVLPTHRIIGHVLFRDRLGHILLVETTYKDDWELPGGIIEANEPPRIGAERELLEELGLEVRLNQPLVIDWMPPYLGWDDAIEFIFDGGVLDESAIAQITLPSTEIRACHWVSADELDAKLYWLSAARLHRLLADPTKVYTECGTDIC